MDTPNAAPAWPPGTHLRPGTPADFPRLAAFLSAAHPDHPVSAHDLQRFQDSRLDHEPWALHLTEQHGELTGMTEVCVPRMDGHPGWLSVDIATQPELAGGPLAEALLTHAETTARHLGAHTLVVRLKEQWWENTFYQKHGYTEHDRMWMSTLDLTTLNFQAFQHYEQQAQAAGIRIQPLSALGTFDETQQHRLYTLIAALLRDVPSTTPISVWPYELWQHRFARTFQHPEGMFIAVTPDGDWVGLSDLRMPVESRPGTLMTGLTGVLQPWRGHGIAHALKLAAAKAALKRGYTHARTSNHSINRPMLSINEKMGFQKETVTVVLVKQVRS